VIARALDSVTVNVTDPKTKEIRQRTIPKDQIENGNLDGTKDQSISLTGWLVVLGSLLAIAWAWWQSKRESAEMRQMDEEFSRAAAAEEREVVHAH
jgi:hypothetical protein